MSPFLAYFRFQKVLAFSAISCLSANVRNGNVLLEPRETKSTDLLIFIMVVVGNPALSLQKQ